MPFSLPTTGKEAREWRVRPEEGDGEGGQQDQVNWRRRGKEEYRFRKPGECARHFFGFRCWFHV